jgi:hypothetical protein
MGEKIHVNLRLEESIAEELRFEAYRRYHNMKSLSRFIEDIVKNHDIKEL